MSYSGTQYHDSCPPPPGVDSDSAFSNSRDIDQRERDRFRRHEHRGGDYRSEREDRYGYGDRSGDTRDYYGDERDIYGQDRESYGHDRETYGRRSRYEGRRSSIHSSEEHADRDERRTYRDRERFRDYDRDRGRGDRERDRDRDRGRERDHSRERERVWDRDRGRDEWREEIPNNTIMVRNLGASITEADIRNEITRYSLQPKDIRLMRKKDSNRAFAFVEFNLLSEAVRWKELTQGLVFFDGQCRSTLHYSIPKEAMGPDRGYSKSTDWTCSKCGVNNFRRRDLCFKCNTPRDDTDLSFRGDGRDEISSYPSNTLLFRNLDVLTTEERVLSMLGQLTMLPIKSLKVAKDSLTNTSRGFAFVELHSTSEATQLHDLLLSMGGNFFVDGRQVTVSYARRSLTAMNGSASANAASVALAAAQWTNQDSSSSNDPSYQQQNESGSVPHGSASVSMPSQAASIGLDTIVIDGVTYRRYPVPDISSYRYDQTSGYYYDPSTGLYYDSNSQYYYNAETQQYLYWDGEKQTYLPAPSSASTADAGLSSTDPNKQQVPASAIPNMSSATIQADPKPATPAENLMKKEPEPSPQNIKQDKVKIAKKIAKDMEKWAKTLNQRKENAKLGITMQAAPHVDVMMASQASSADAGFAVLEKRASAAERNALVTEALMMSGEDRKFGVPSQVIEKPTLVAAYGGESDSEPELDNQDDGSKAYDLLKAEELKLTDWSKIACLMCKRQFPNRETLIRHQQLSDLHKQNLDVLKLTKLTPQQVEDLERRERESGYRDRAKERRKKFGQPDDPPPNRLKTKYLKSREDVVQAEQPTKSGIGSDNIGNKMLKAMGWTEGQGLGKSGQGMSGIIEVQQRSKTAGLGMKGSTYGAAAGDSYKDAVKKAMQARFKEISDQ